MRSTKLIAALAALYVARVWRCCVARPGASRGRTLPCSAHEQAALGPRGPCGMCRCCGKHCTTTALRRDVAGRIQHSFSATLRLRLALPRPPTPSRRAPGTPALAWRPGLLPLVALMPTYAQRISPPKKHSHTRTDRSLHTPGPTRVVRQPRHLARAAHHTVASAPPSCHIVTAKNMQCSAHCACASSGSVTGRGCCSQRRPRARARAARAARHAR